MSGVVSNVEVRNADLGTKMIEVRETYDDGKFTGVCHIKSSKFSPDQLFDIAEKVSSEYCLVVVDVELAIAAKDSYQEAMIHEYIKQIDKEAANV